MMLFPMMFRIPDDYNIPPTLYSILNSIVNFENEDPVKIKDLARYSRSKIFDFDYPLSQYADKEEFECMILNHYIMRRIGYETMTAFKIALNVKLNEIMPMYNKLFDSIHEWNIFNDGELTERNVRDTRDKVENNNLTNNLSNNTSTNNISDRRNSELPQDQIINVQNGSYMTDYNYDTDTGNSISTSNSSSINNITNNENGELSEIIKRTPADKMKNYKEFIESKRNIMSMIFKDLDPLFYGLI